MIQVFSWVTYDNLLDRDGISNKSQFVHSSMIHSSLLSVFGLNATSTYDSYLPLIFGKFALIWGHFQNILTSLSDLKNDLLTSMTSEEAQRIFSKITFLKTVDQAEKNAPSKTAH